MIVYDFYKMTLESNNVAKLFVSHTNLTFNEDDNVVSDKNGCFNKANVFDFDFEEEVKDKCDIGAKPFSKRNGGVGNFNVDWDLIDEDYRVIDDDDLFDNLVDELEDRNASGTSSN